MKTICLILSLFACEFYLFGEETDLVEYVNPLMGSQSESLLSNGNTYPVIALPWGMNFWTPQTGKMGDGWIYNYNAHKILGFKQTHEPSPWINDYGQFSIMPVSGKPLITEDKRASWFSHKAEIATPYFYKVYLADYDITTEIAPTERAVIFRFTFPETENSYIVIDAFDEGSYIKIVPEENKIIGYTTKNSGGVPDNFKNYFVITFDTPFSSASVWSDSTIVPLKNELTANHVGAVVQFKTHKGEQVSARVASSFINFEQAMLNLKELGDSNFETVKSRAKAAWNEGLGRIWVEGGTIDQLKTFYTCLYRTMLFPRKFYEINPKGEIVHYSPYNGQVMPGYMFTDNGFWDTFRADFPLLNLIHPSSVNHIQQGLINTYLESGWLPEWASPGHRDCMIGSNSASIVAEAWLKGSCDYDGNKLYEAILKNTKNEGPLGSVGRKGVKYYNEIGYVPYNVGINENAARTLEYAYDDFAVYQMAKALNRPKSEIRLFAQSCQNFRNVFDSTYNLMRGRNLDGSFQEPFSPFKWGDAFTEGNSLHYTWSVFHDIQGLIDLMGGQKPFIAMLDTVFVLPPVFDDSYYGFPIHEIREMQISGMGNYAHGNQPIQHMIYLYNYAGEPWKTQYWVRQVMDRMYTPHPDGYCGDEDNGQTSAWYVFSAMGFYPVCPVSDQYVMGAPLFKHITIHLENGNIIDIQAPENSDENIYITSARLNGKSWDKNWLSHTMFGEGAHIEFSMGASPNKLRGIHIEDFPYSFSKDEISP
jgi:predicted alpha-1,2-mannosidase